MAKIISLSQRTTSQQSLDHRRRAATIRRLLIAICSGLAVVCLSQSLTVLQQKEQIVITTRAISQGTHISADTLKEVYVPTSAVNTVFLKRKLDIVGKIARYNIQPGQPLLDQSLSTTPVIPKGFTTVRLTLASSPGTLDIGQRVKLMASMACQPEEMQSERSHKNNSCLISDKAIIMPAMDAAHDSSGRSSHKEATVTVAMAAAEAMRVLQLPEGIAVIAVSTT